MTSQEKFAAMLRCMMACLPAGAMGDNEAEGNDDLRDEFAAWDELSDEAWANFEDALNGQEDIEFRQTGEW